MCGCRRARDAREHPRLSGDPVEDANAEAVELEHAADLQREWGCPAVGYAPPLELPLHLALAAESVAKVTDTEPCGTCPFAELERAPEWVIEITTAAMAMGESLEPLTFRTVTGRSPTFADVTAWLAWKRAGSAAWRSDQKAAEERRKKPT